MKLVRVGLVLAVAVGIFGMYTSVLGATTLTTWRGVTGAVVSVSEVSGVTWKSWYQPHCTPERAVVVDYSERVERDICVVSSDHVKLARYRVGGSGSNSTLYALRRDTDQEYHRIGYLIDLANLTLLDNDTVIGASLSGSALSMYTMEHFQSQFTEEYIQNGGGVVNKVYNLNMAAARYPTDAVGRRIPVHAIAVSSNNAYAVVRVAGRGIARIDLATSEVKLVADDVASYPDTVVAISDDGNTIAVTGNKRAPHKIYTDIEQCGADDIYAWLTDTEICPFVSFGSEIAPLLDVSTLYNLKVDTNSLSAYLWDESKQMSHRLTLTPDPVSYRLDYLALGDSYSSGEGDTGRDAAGQSYYLPRTDKEPDTCHVSSRSYPFLLRDKWMLNPTRMKSVACSGARVVQDYSVPLTSYQGQNRRLVGRSDIAALRTTALAQFIPGHVPQIEFVKKYQPRVLTLTGGGNDVGFADILKYCATPYWEDMIPVLSDCGYAKQGSTLEQMLFDSIDTQYSYNKSMIQALKTASPSTKIVIVGYPSFITDKSPTGCVPNSGSLTRVETQMINRMVDRMNTMLKGVAYDTGVNYVDIADSLNGGRICEGGEYMSGTWGNVTDRAKMSAMFHPNARGHQQIARTISEKYSFNSLTIPTTSVYTRLSNSITYTFNLVQNGVGFLNDQMRLGVPAGTFAPSSQYTVTLHSNPTKLGTFVTNSDGSLSVDVSTASASIGRHVLVVEGTGSDGKPLRLYQFIEIHASEDDADGDGILNSKDRCQFINSWIDEQTGEDVCRPILDIADDSLTVDVADESARLLATSAPKGSIEIEDAAASLAIPSQRTTAQGAHQAALLDTVADDQAAVNHRNILLLGGVCVILMLVIGWRVYIRAKTST